MLQRTTVAENSNSIFLEKPLRTAPSSTFCATPYGSEVKPNFLSSIHEDIKDLHRSTDADQAKERKHNGTFVCTKS